MGTTSDIGDNDGVSPELVIFDLDGTLTDSRDGILRSTRYALQRLNEATGRSAPVPEESGLEYMLGPPLRDTFAGLVGAADVEALLGFYRERYRTTGLFENRPYEGICEALAILASSGFGLFVATSKNEEDARRVLAHFDMAKFFQGIYGAQHDGGRAVKSDLLRHVLRSEELNADAANIVMIGDRRYDILGAHAVGIKAMGALWGYGARDELVEAGADFLIGTPSEIPAAVQDFARSLA
jgi:phosphoglycolate phosphatase